MISESSRFLLDALETNREIRSFQVDWFVMLMLKATLEPSQFYITWNRDIVHDRRTIAGRIAPCNYAKKPYVIKGSDATGTSHKQ